ncbi:hypothetical protein [Sphaerobacter sp.]|uniref:hypothetical protein n=1 Tax=Sphaerobacter sp. TaxID=2099654 RepID=UPI001E0A8353|nr:hypothetical protein [Sphaerobacter sp.]MBX5446319.1 hypothetical protein [Sphaerobacter sp.]
MERPDEVVERPPENESPEHTEQGADGTEGFDLERIRELILAAHPDVVPDMITGTTFDELMASIEPARAAYARIAERIRSQPGNAPGIPAGQPGRQPSPAHVERLSASAKIAEGLRRRRG